MAFPQIFNRYIHCRSDKLYFCDLGTQKVAPNVIINAEKMRELSMEEVAKCINLAQTAVANKTLVRKLELMQLLALMVQNLENAESKHAIYLSLESIIISFDDLTLFLKCYRTFGRAIEHPLEKVKRTKKKEEPAEVEANTEEEANQKEEDEQKPEEDEPKEEDEPAGKKRPLLPVKGFGRGVRAFVKKWYAKKTLEALCEMLSHHRSLNGFSHRDVIRLCHVKYNEGSPLHLAFSRAGKYKVPEDQKEIQKGLLKVCKLKVNENFEQAIREIIDNRFKVDVLPSHLIKNSSVWQKALLHSANYSTLIKWLPMLQDSNFLTQEGEFWRHMKNALENHRLLKDANMHPFQLFHVWKLYEKNRRYLEFTKNSKHQEKMKRRSVETNAEIAKTLEWVFEKSFEYKDEIDPKLRFVICVDNRYPLYSRTIVSGNNHFVSVWEISLLIALTFLKWEQNCTVLTFSKTGVEPLEIDKKASFQTVYDSLEQKQKDKTQHKVGLPIEYATEKKIPADVFIVLTDSVVNIAPLNKPPTKELDAYQKATNVDPKLIVLGLARRQVDLHNDDPRVLEIAGFTPDTHKVIKAFIQNAFK